MYFRNKWSIRQALINTPICALVHVHCFLSPDDVVFYLSTELGEAFGGKMVRNKLKCIEQPTPRTSV